MSRSEWADAVEVEPSIYASDFSRLGAQLETLHAAGAKVFHFDVGDGHFIPEITVGPIVLASISPLAAPSGTRVRVTRGSDSIRPGKSQEWLTATSDSSSPSAQTISVPLASSEAIRIGIMSRPSRTVATAALTPQPRVLTFRLTKILHDLPNFIG